MLPYHTYYRLTRRRLPMAAEVKPIDPENRAWVSVYPQHDGSYVVHYFEILSETIESGYDFDGDALKHERKIRELHDDSLEMGILQFLDDPEQLMPTHASDFPL